MVGACENVLDSNWSCPPILSTIETCDVVKAKGMLANDFEMTFPGGAVFCELEQLIEWSKPRYKLIKKTLANVSHQDE